MNKRVSESMTAKRETRILNPLAGGVDPNLCPACPFCDRLIGYEFHERGCRLHRADATAILDAIERGDIRAGVQHD